MTDDRQARRAALALLDAQAHEGLERMKARLTAHRQALGLPPAPEDVAAARGR